MQHGRSFEIDQRIWTALENIVNSYDKVTHSITLCLDDILREEAVKDIKKSRVLDVGAGTGALSNKLREKDKSCYIVMLDPIKNFNLYLKKNKENDVVQGVAEYLPFKFKAFDFAISAFMLRDAMDLDKALQNFKRVALKNVILDFWKPDNIIILFFELLYMFSLMPLLAMARDPWNVRHYLAIPYTVMKVPKLKTLVKRLKKNGELKFRKFFKGIFFIATIENY